MVLELGLSPYLSLPILLFLARYFWPQKQLPTSLSKEGILTALYPSQIPEAAQLAANAFIDSPSYVSIFQISNPEERRAALAWLFEKNLGFYQFGQFQCVSYLENGSLRTAVLFGLSPFYYKPSLAKLTHTISINSKILTSGILMLIVYYGLSACLRIFKIMGLLEATMDSSLTNYVAKNNLPSTIPLILLERMVVAPHLHGRGLGSKYLLQALNSNQHENSYCICTTQEERNVKFYQKLGFEVIGECDSVDPDPRYTFHSWIMLRPPSKE